mmetsp:Transcript_9278/g.21780  ORF Transcript_9278/g.21780 Transcript_9278/m.21780 type:complete len:271 (+) Transcript_9278:64-876(+)|eukprot:CAMPEP_0171093648 /NCGR_PEP_ID=MMETSP0766_2-20121228/39203_1 /TAXON_ID=439317 /ORGANISM="Gambierdiscus australes, Strain CAWD 149" /LENGTH=270 /DNA_ID=CAMNT_0011552131 /DNA_START=63 /DNA_END=875 /DNA_ORIENTATION=-
MARAASRCLLSAGFSLSLFLSATQALTFLHTVCLPSHRMRGGRAQPRTVMRQAPLAKLGTIRGESALAEIGRKHWAWCGLGISKAREIGELSYTEPATVQETRLLVQRVQKLWSRQELGPSNGAVVEPWAMMERRQRTIDGLQEESQTVEQSPRAANGSVEAKGVLKVLRDHLAAFLRGEDLEPLQEEEEPVVNPAEEETTRLLSEQTATLSKLLTVTRQLEERNKQLKEALKASQTICVELFSQVHELESGRSTWTADQLLQRHASFSA